jgi:hypothetical protein
MVHRVWQANGLKPYLHRTFKLSNPPEHAMVFSVDEKSQIQALDRTQPGLPIKRALRHDAPRLQAEWDHDAVCRHGHT